MKTIIATGLMLSGACTPTVHIQVLKPSAIVVPAHIQDVAFLDRSEAQGLGEGVLGVVEGLVTGEDPGQDHQGRAAAGDAMKEILSNSPRFKIVELGQTNVSSSLFDEQMAWGAATRACKRAGCQGLIALEAFDSDSTVETRHEDYTELQDGKEVHKKQWHASRDTQVMTAWRFYDVEKKRVVHQLHDHSSQASWEFEGTSEQEAIDALPAQSETVRNIGGQAGDYYGRLIAPSYITVSRPFFVRGDSRLKSQKNRVKAGAWQPAEAAWVELWESNAKDKVKARAAHNIAVSQEVGGNLDSAVEWAREAAILWPKGHIGRYVHILEKRQQQAAELLEQMNPPESPDVENTPEADNAPPAPPKTTAPPPEEPKESEPTMGPPPR